MDRGFFVFRWVKKKVLLKLFGDFVADLKKYFNMIFSSYVGTVFDDAAANAFIIIFSVADDIFQNSVKSEMFQNHFSCKWQSNQERMETKKNTFVPNVSQISNDWKRKKKLLSHI